MPWLVVVGAVVLRGIQGGFERLDAGQLAVLLIAGAIAVSIIAAPVGGWLALMGLAPSAVGVGVLLVAVGIASYAEWERRTYGTMVALDLTGFIFAGLGLLASGLGVLLLGAWDMTHRPPRSDQSAGSIAR